MTLVIIIKNKDYCHIALYKLNCIVLLLLYMYIVYDSPLNFWIFDFKQLLLLLLLVKTLKSLVFILCLLMIVARYM